ncbi:MAG TPA: carbon storage regulator CsrA [Chloroflexota bacterium]|nr:carbon storage regulator CsrA [Chloroflexota bacterium]
MLILTRKVNERIIIGNEVEITVLKVSRDKVKLGIKAPESIMIQRNELLMSVGEENRRAAGPLTGLERLLPALRQQLQGA